MLLMHMVKMAQMKTGKKCLIRSKYFYIILKRIFVIRQKKINNMFLRHFFLENHVFYFLFL